MATRVNVQVNQAAVARAIGKALGSRRAGTLAQVIANKEGQKVKRIAERIAKDELHRRPDDRRTQSSLAHGKEYHDSFVVRQGERTGQTAAEVKIGNTHPAHAIIEKGSKEHPIPTGSKGLIFPWKGLATQRSGPGRKGNFAVAYGEAPTRKEPIGVQHPGTEAHNIMPRAAQEYAAKSKYNVRVRTSG